VIEALYVDPRGPYPKMVGVDCWDERRSPERYKKSGCAVPPGIKVCSAQQRRRTPPLFAEYLVRLAQSARQP
jgi:hypothetical protein